MKINAEKCVACGNCTYVCPMGAIYIDQKIHRATINRDECVECYACFNGLSQERKAGVKSHVLQIVMAILVQIRGEPVEISREAVVVAKIHRGQIPEAGVRKDLSPGNRRARASLRASGGRADQVALSGVRARVLIGNVAIIKQPRGRPDDAHNAESNERGAPVVASDDPDNQRRRHRRA